jgi:hypothetical protein
LLLVFGVPGFSKGDRCLPTECAVLSVDVVVDPPVLCQYLSVEQAVEQLTVQVLVPEPTVEALIQAFCQGDPGSMNKVPARDGGNP